MDFSAIGRNYEALKAGYETLLKQAPGELAKVRDHVQENWYQVTFVVILCTAAYFKGGQLAMIYTAGACLVFYQIYGQTQKVFQFLDLKGVALPLLAILHGISRGTLESYVTAYVGFLLLVREYQRGKEVAEEVRQLEQLKTQAESINRQQEETIKGFNGFFEKWNTEVHKFYENNTEMLALWKGLKEKTTQLKDGATEPSTLLSETLTNLQEVEKEIEKSAAGKVAELTKDARELIEKKAKLLEAVKGIEKELELLNQRDQQVSEQFRAAIVQFRAAVNEFRLSQKK